MSTAIVHDTLDRLLGRVGRSLTPDAARRVLEIRADDELQQRLDDLADRSTAGTPTDVERQEYESLGLAGDLSSVLQAHAARVLD